MALSCDSLEGSDRDAGAKINKKVQKIYMAFYGRSLKQRCSEDQSCPWTGWRDLGQAGHLSLRQQHLPNGIPAAEIAAEGMSSLTHDCFLK